MARIKSEVEVFRCPSGMDVASEDAKETVAFAVTTVSLGLEYTLESSTFTSDPWAVLLLPSPFSLLSLVAPQHRFAIPLSKVPQARLPPGT